MVLDFAEAEHHRVWLRSRHYCCCCCRHRHGNNNERAMHLWQTVGEHRHPPAVRLPLRHVGEGDREVHQASPGDQRAQERAAPVPHPESYHQGQTNIMLSWDDDRKYSGSLLPDSLYHEIAHSICTSQIVLQIDWVVDRTDEQSKDISADPVYYCCIIYYYL